MGSSPAISLSMINVNPTATIRPAPSPTNTGGAFERSIAMYTSTSRAPSAIRIPISFVRRFAERTGKKIDGVDEKAMAELAGYGWPGNVRELENTIERAVVLSTGTLLTSQSVWLMSATATPATASIPSLKLHQNLEWAERETMRRALAQSRGVKKDAAELMGISQRALSHYLAKYRIEE